MRKDRMKTKEYSAGSTVLTVAFVLICLVWIMPIYEVVVNSLKSNNAINLDVFALPNSESFVGFANYVKGMTFGNYPFLKSVGYSLFISVVSTALILLCCSMAAWYIARVRSGFAKFFYYLCLFSMIVPFQMVMFTLTSTADSLKLNTPWTIPVIYLGFGAGLAIFMFVGFVKSLPLEIEEAASIDGCGPVRTYFNVVLPMLKPTLISVGILELMWDDQEPVWVRNPLSPAVSGSGHHQVPHHPHPRPVPEGQLWHRGSGRDHGGHHDGHSAHHHCLPVLPEVHHQGRRCRRSEGLSSRN